MQPTTPSEFIGRMASSLGAATSSRGLTRQHEADLSHQSEHGSAIEEREERTRNPAAHDDRAADTGGERVVSRAQTATAAPLLPSAPETSFLAMSLASIEIMALDLGAGVAATEALPTAGKAPAQVAPALPSLAAGMTSLLALGAESVSSEDGTVSSASLARGAENAAIRLVDRGLHALLQQRGGTMILRLSPPELGALEIRMRLEAGRVEVLFRASGAEASRLLEGNLSMLRQSLERHGVGVGRLAVEPPEFRRAEESARPGVEDSFDAGGHESQGRQEAERELRWRTDSSAVMASLARPMFEIAGANEGTPPCPPSHPASIRSAPFPAATAS